MFTSFPDGNSEAQRGGVTVLSHSVVDGRAEAMTQVSSMSMSSSCNTGVWSKGFYPFINSFVDTALIQKGIIIPRQCEINCQVILEILSTQKDMKLIIQE